jgi:hypothetical protein
MHPAADNQLAYAERWLERARQSGALAQETCLRLAQLSKQSAIQIDRSENLLGQSRELLVAANAILELEKVIAPPALTAMAN